jgi:glutamine amidotransferase
LMIAIVDYGVGNLHSVRRVLESLGYETEITGDPERVTRAAGVIIPGVGSFTRAMERFRQVGLVTPVREAAAAGRPVLGICLGMHLLLESGSEGGGSPGLGLIPGRVERLPVREKLPHMGWNLVRAKTGARVFAGLPDSFDCYFVHSYAAFPTDRRSIAAETDYGITFASAVATDNIVGLQFHPEKSSALGLQILKNFGEWTRCK